MTDLNRAQHFNLKYRNGNGTVEHSLGDMRRRRPRRRRRREGRRKGLREARLQPGLRRREGGLPLRFSGRAAGPVHAGGAAPRGRKGMGSSVEFICLKSGFWPDLIQSEQIYHWILVKFA